MSAFAPEEDDYSYAEADPAETSTPPDQSGNDAEASHGRHSNNPLLGSDNPMVSDLEQEVLEEYARLLRNVNQVREVLCSIGLFILSA
jgi:DASH complex subunit DAD3